MKPSTYTETVEMVTAWSCGKLKFLIVQKHITYDCAKKRILRFRSQYPLEYRRIVKCPFLSLSKSERV